MSHDRGPSPENRILRRFQELGGSPPGRDMTPAVGKRGQPADWRRAVEGAEVAGFRGHFQDPRWSYLYKDGTQYRRTDIDETEVREAARRMRGGPDVPDNVQGPFIHPAVWTWEVPLYFWFGGIATGASFVAVAADIVGDRRSARIARLAALGAAMPSAPLLVLDLGRPLRFLHMMRIFKPRSPMSMGAWCLSAFSGAAAASVVADMLQRPRTARALAGCTAVLGTYLGSYTGVLLASTAVPVWNRSRAMLPPIFVCTATATGAAATRLALSATGLPRGHPTRAALGTIETAAMTTELVLSAVNERRLGPLRHALDSGRPATLFKAAKTNVALGLALRLARHRLGPRAHDAASALYLLAGLLFRFAWVGAGRTSAHDDLAVARTARTQRKQRA